MKIPNDKEKYLNSWQLVETARYVPSLSRIIRDKDGDNPRFISIFNIEKSGNAGAKEIMNLLNEIL